MLVIPCPLGARGRERGEVTVQAHKTLDCRGMACPMPIVKLSKAIKEMSPGEILAVSADDPGFEADVKAWCETTGNQLKGLESEGELRTAYIAKI